MPWPRPPGRKKILTQWATRAIAGEPDPPRSRNIAAVSHRPGHRNAHALGATSAAPAAGRRRSRSRRTAIGMSGSARRPTRLTRRPASFLMARLKAFRHGDHRRHGLPSRGLPPHGPASGRSRGSRSSAATRPTAATRNIPRTTTSSATTSPRARASGLQVLRLRSPEPPPRGDEGA